jgi:hypothetical protein
MPTFPQNTGKRIRHRSQNRGAFIPTQESKGPPGWYPDDPSMFFAPHRLDRARDSARLERIHWNPFLVLGQARPFITPGAVMALYKYDAYVSKSTDTVFDGEQKPGETASHAGIFRCLGCGREVTSHEGGTLPPQNHHQHTAAQGSIRWRLAVYADHRPK